MKTKRVGMYRPKHTKKNTNNKSKMPTKKTIKHKTIKRRPYNENKTKNVRRNWIDDFIYDEENVVGMNDYNGGGKINRNKVKSLKSTKGARAEQSRNDKNKNNTRNLEEVSTDTQKAVEPDTQKAVEQDAIISKKAEEEATAKKAEEEATAKKAEEEATAKKAEEATAKKAEEEAIISKKAEEDAGNPVVQVTPIETVPISEGSILNTPEVTTDKKIEEETVKNKDDSSCPSRDKTPHPPADKRDYRKETLIFHPDKNKGCSDSANKKFLKLNEMEELRNNPKTSNNNAQLNSSISTDTAEKNIADNTSANTITNTPYPKLSTDIETSSSIKKKISANDTILKPTELSTTKETDYNNSIIGKFDVSISYPNGLSGSPIVNLIGAQGGDTDAVFGAISQESETPSLSKVTGGKSRSLKKNNQSKKPKKPKNPKKTRKTKTMKHRK